MPEPQQDFTPKQLLERLVRLEEKNARLTDKLRETVLRYESLSRAFQAELKCSVKHHQDLCTRIAYLYDIFSPVLYKVFPNYAHDKAHINKILKRPS